MLYVLPAPLIVLVLMGGCAAVPVPAPADRAHSYALADPESTRLARMLKPYAAGQDGRSGFSLIESGPEALALLRSFVALAEKTLDLQYYSWKADQAGRLLLSDLVDAAESGVRIRLLLDDMDTEWTDDDLARLNAHPNFAVRIFNPFANRENYVLDLLVDFQRVTHRMHNKLFVADNVVAITGGRNVGDRYFSADSEANYRDLDILAAGPITRALSRSFDDFWNSAWSISVNQLAEGRESPADLRRLVERLRRSAAASAGKLPATGDDFEPAKQAAAAFSRLVWSADAAVVADTPNKPRTAKSRLLDDMAARLAGDLKSELLIESAYLIPGKTGVDALCGFVKGGIAVRALTNSLASTDAITAYSAYRKYRKPLLQCGVEIYEMRPNAAFVAEDWTWTEGTSAANLHSKAAVFDGRYVFVGSFNLDPRSVYLNTEIALLVDSRPLAAATARFIRDGMSLENAYHLTLEDGEIVWHTRENGALVRLTEEPGTSLWQQIVTGLISLLPVERQL
jgi:putative cardiolipin synthase